MVRHRNSKTKSKEGVFKPRNTSTPGNLPKSRTSSKTRTTTSSSESPRRIKKTRTSNANETPTRNENTPNLSGHGKKRY